MQQVQVSVTEPAAANEAGNVELAPWLKNSRPLRTYGRWIGKDVERTVADHGCHRGSPKWKSVGVRLHEHDMGWNAAVDFGKPCHAPTKHPERAVENDNRT